MGNFVHLHNHTEYSFLDGVPTLPDLVDHVIGLGQDSIAMTDHGEVSGHLKFQKACEAKGIKPIFGLEGYFVDDANIKTEDKRYDYEHITLLATTQEGLENLWTISSRAFIEGGYYKPRIDWNMLTDNSSGIIATSGCINGCVAAFLNDEEREDGSNKYNPAKAEERISRFHEIFKENFYFEIHTFTEPRQIILNNIMVEKAREYGIPMIGVSDSHYLNADQSEKHEILIAAQMRKKFDDPKRYRYPVGSLAVISEEQVRERLNYLPNEVVNECIENTVKIADMVETQIEAKRTFPVFFNEKSEDEIYLEKTAWQKFDERLARLGVAEDKMGEYRERLTVELELVINKGFAGYFLIVADMINWAKKNGILIGPGRGSAGGSLLSYVLGITEIDPVAADLMFERFLTAGRNSLPDIDIDVPQLERQELKDYLTTKYDVATVGTLLALAPKMLLRDFARVLDIPAKDVDEMISIIDSTKDLVVLDKSWEVVYEENREAFELPREYIYAAVSRTKKSWVETYPQLFELMDEFAAHYRHAGAHAAGIVVSRDKIMGKLPLRFKDGDIRTQMEQKDVEELGFVKFDLLGLRNLSTLMRAYKNAKDNNPDGDVLGNSWGENAADYFYSWQYDFKDYYEDQDVYKSLWKGKNVGIFQIEGSEGMNNLTKAYKPKSLEDMCSVVSLFRPGITRAVDPVTNLNLMELYIEKRHKRMPVKYKHELLKPILQNTYGAFLYQEQVMKALGAISGYTLEEQDKVRGIMGKSKGEAMRQEMAFHKQKFLDQAIIDEKTAEAIWNEMEQFGIYAFNRSHGYAYGMIAYWCAWMKYYYPGEYMVALFQTNEVKIKEYIRECRRMNIPVLVPDINESKSDFAYLNGNIRYGLHGVKFVANAADIIQELRPFTSVNEALIKLSVPQVNKRVMESLIRVGSLDSIVTEEDRAGLPPDWSNSRVALWLLFKNKRRLGKKDKALDDESFFNKYSLEFEEYCEQTNIDDKGLNEMELLGDAVESTPFGKWLELIKKTATFPGSDNMVPRESCMMGGLIKRIRPLVVKKEGPNKGRDMCQMWVEYPLIENDKVIDIDTVQIVVFHDTYDEFSAKIEEDAPVMARVEKLNGDGGLALNKLYRLDQDL